MAWGWENFKQTFLLYELFKFCFQEIHSLVSLFFHDVQMLCLYFWLHVPKFIKMNFNSEFRSIHLTVPFTNNHSWLLWYFPLFWSSGWLWARYWLKRKECQYLCGSSAQEWLVIVFPCLWISHLQSFPAVLITHNTMRWRQFLFIGL